MKEEEDDEEEAADASGGESSTADENIELPENWVARKDPATGKTFFGNVITGETSWTPPQLANTIDSLPEGWERRQDEASGRYFFANPSTGETSWIMPTKAVSDGLAQNVEEVKPQLPPGWEARFDEASGRTFTEIQALVKLRGQCQRMLMMMMMMIMMAMSESSPLAGKFALMMPVGEIFTPIQELVKHRGTILVQRVPLRQRRRCQLTVLKVKHLLRVKKESEDEEGVNLPENWVARDDPATGRTYYGNLLTGETTWTAPIAEQDSLPRRLGEAI